MTIFECGDSIAVLIQKRSSNELVLVERFRGPALEKGRNNGWMIEAVAGNIKDGETPEQAVAREAREQTGFEIENPKHIVTFFSPPGGTSERIFLYHAEVEEAETTAGGGNRNEGEHIRIVTMTPAELLERLLQSTIDDPKLIIAVHDLKDRIQSIRPMSKPLASGTIKFVVTERPELIIGIKTGEIREVEGVDVWVNSENTDMMMDRVIGKSISANIRYGGAEKDGKGAVRVDTIARDLRRRLNGRVHVHPATVLETTAGALAAKPNMVKRIIHVAAVDRIGPGKGVGATPENIKECMKKVLEHVEGRKSRFNIFSKADRSILVPLLGAGEGGLRARIVASLLVNAALTFFQAYPETALREVYLLAYTETDKDACMSSLLKRPELAQA